MAVKIPDNFTFSLQDVKDLTMFLLNKPNDLVDAFSKANQTTGSTPFNTRWDGRYYSSGVQSLRDFRNYGAAGLEGLERISGSYLTSFTFNTFISPGQGGIFNRNYWEVDTGDGTGWFGLTPSSTAGDGSKSMTVSMSPNSTGTARFGAFYMKVFQNGTQIWQSRNVIFNQPSL